MQLAMPLADLRALTPVLGTPVHPCGTFTLDRRARLPLAHAASPSKLRGYHVDLRYPGTWRCRGWHGMWSCTRLDCRPGPLRLQAVPLTH